MKWLVKNQQFYMILGGINWEIEIDIYTLLYIK